MTREQYMNELASAISHCPKMQQEEILADFNEHFDIALSKGQSAEEIIESLGDIQDFINDLKVEQDLTPAVQNETDSEISEVEIVCDNCDVLVIEGEEVKMNLKGWRASMSNTYDVTETVENNKYIVHVIRKPNRFFFNYDNDLRMEVSIHAAAQKLKVENKNGDITLKLSQMQLREAALESKNGDVEVYGTIGNLTASSKNGDVQVNGFVYQCNCDTLNGDVEIEVMNGKNIQASSGLGDVQVKANVETVHAKTNKGDVEFEVEANFLKVHSGMGDVDGKAKVKEIHCSTQMGSIECEIIDADNVTCTSSLGDVEVYVAALEGFVIDASSGLGEVEMCVDDVMMNKGRYVKGNQKTSIHLQTSMGDIVICE